MAGRKEKDEGKRRDYNQGSLFWDEARERWCASFSYADPATGNRKYRRKFGKNKGPLNDWLDEMKSMKKAGKSLDPKSATIKEWLPVWLSEYKKSIRPTTRASYSDIIQRIIVPEIGALKIRETTPLDIQAFIGKIEKKYSPRGVQYARGILSQSLKDAEEDGLIDRNPVRGKKTKGPRVPKPEIFAPEQVDIQRFLEAAKKTYFYHYFLILASTGCRKGEALGLKWTDIDFDTVDGYGSISIQRGVIYTKETGVAFSEPKTKSGKRRIKMPIDVIGELKAHRLKQKELRLQNADVWQDEKLCFPVQDGSLQNPDNIANAFYRIMKSAGLGKWVEEEGKKKRFDAAWRLHDLRHAHASDLFAAGWDAEAVRERLGHEDVAITLQIYAHVRASVQKRMAEGLSGKYILGA